MLLALVLTVSAFADQPFRSHRENGFMVLPSAEGDVLFLGNSITNMHEWKEAFSNSPKVKGRGVSGGYSYEIANMLETYLNGRPSKVFIMIGTNDMGTSGYTVESTVSNISRIIRRIAMELPETDVYYESILPSTSGIRTLANLSAVNQGVADFITAEGNDHLHYVDLYNNVPTNQGGDWSYDNLHCTAKAYAAWCNIIQDGVGIPTTYPADYASMTLNRGGISSAAYAMRATVFAAMPVDSDNIVFIGDEMVHSGEWAELLGNAKVLNRGTGWGWPAGPFNILQSELQCIFHDGATPKQVVLYAGNDALNGSGTVADAFTNYKSLVSNIRSTSPKSKILLCGLIPGSDATKNAQKYVPYNDSLRALAETDSMLTYVDTYTPMLNGSVANTDLISGNYILGRGYVKFANTIAPYIEGCTPITEEDAAARYTLNQSRNTLGQAIHSALNLTMAADVSRYDSVAIATLDSTLNVASVALAASVAADSLSALTTAVNAATAAAAATWTVKPSTAEEEYWYSFCSSLRSNRYTYETDDNKLAGGTNTGYKRMMWKFVEREDGTYDIINRNSGRYISPSASYNTQITTVEEAPATGWTMTPASTAGMFVLSNGTVELNQTNLDGLPVYNWSSSRNGDDITDTGCQLSISEVTVPPVLELGTGWYRIKATEVTPNESLNGNYVYNGAEWRQNASNSYPLFLNTDGSVPDLSDAAYYVRLINSNGLYVQSTNGHYLNDKTCAERTMSHALAFNYSSSTADYTIGNYWMYFQMGDYNIVGKASSGSGNRWALEEVDPEAQGYDVWTVNITGATNASEVMNDQQLTLSTTGASGLTTVYTGGYLFLPKGTVPTAEEVDCAGGTVTIDTDALTITVDVSVPSGLSAATATPASTAKTYDLQGRRTKLNGRGVFVTNGKKVVR